MRKKVANIFLRIINAIIHPIEHIFLNKNDAQLNYPPIFIVGPARAGTTLIYQSIIDNFETSYINNFSAYLYKAPLTALYLINKVPFVTSKNRGYSSYYGKISGVTSPSQGQKIWRRWFKKGEHEIKTIANIDLLKKTIKGIEEYYDLPFVNKWPAHSVYIPQLRSLFSNAVFIHVTRDYAQVAQSLLKGRKELKGDPQQNITQQPRCYEKFEDCDPVTQVCAYVVNIEKTINNDLDNVPSFKIKYEEFCENPNQILKSFKQWYLDKTGYDLKRKTVDSLPGFEASNSKKVSDDEVKRIIKTLQDLLGKKEFNNQPLNDE